jgi:site-specific DNA-methyltransferase (adenine-specific)
MKPYYESDLGRLYHGDCLEIMPQLEPVDLVLTDPPYNCNKKYGICKDNLSKKEYGDLIDFVNSFGKERVIILGSQILREWWLRMETAKLVIVSVRAGMSALKPKGFVPKFRPLLTTKSTNKFMGDLWDDIRWSGEGYFFKEQNYAHPTIAPLKLMNLCVQIFTDPETLVADPFSGSGTTAVACERLKRRWIGIEIEEKYCEIAAKRIELETKQLKMF